MCRQHTRSGHTRNKSSLCPAVLSLGNEHLLKSLFYKVQYLSSEISGMHLLIKKCKTKRKEL